MIDKVGYDGNDLPNYVIRLGLNCNERCLFCNVPPESGEIAGQKYAIKKILETPPGCAISLSGGEPTIYKYLPLLIKLAKKRGIITELQTNAMLLADVEKTKILSNAGLDKAFVSLHSHIARIHDFLTDTEGSWKKSIIGIKNLCDEGIEVIVNTVLTSVNYTTLPDFVLFLSKRIGIKYLSLSVVQPRRRALINKALIPDYANLDFPVRKALYISKREGLYVINPICGLPLCIGGWEKYLEQSTEYVQSCFKEQFCQGKIHTEKCQKCAAKKYCGGIWQEYYAMRGDSSLTPFLKDLV